MTKPLPSNSPLLPVLPFMCSRTSSLTASCPLNQHGGCPEEAPGRARDSRLPLAHDVPLHVQACRT